MFNNLVDFIEIIDCVSGAHALPEMHMDLIITDAPFAIDFSAKCSDYSRGQVWVLESCKENQIIYLARSMEGMSLCHKELIQ